mgnify:FL=1
MEDLSEKEEQARLAEARILVVDDHVHARRLLRFQLRKYVAVQEAGSFDEALALCEEQMPDVALIDIHLGEARTGVDLLQALRALPGGQRLRAIACTAYAVPGSRERFLEAGFDEYLAKPIHTDQLLRVLQRVLDPSYRPDRTRLGLPEWELKLPPQPETITAVMELLSRDEEEIELKQLIELLHEDPITAAWVLRHVNSAYYALPHKVTTIERAVTMLGFLPVGNLVLTEVVTNAFEQVTTPEARHIHKHIMRVSLSTALFARELAALVEQISPEQAFTAGVLHQLGRLVFLSSAPERYIPLWKTNLQGGSQWLQAPSPDDEVRTFGLNYAQLGADIARDWGMPELLIEAIRFHLDPRWATGRGRLLALLVRAGRTLALQFGCSGEVLAQLSPEELPPPVRGALRELAEATRVSVQRFWRHVLSRSQAIQELACSYRQ